MNRVQYFGCIVGLTDGLLAKHVQRLFPITVFLLVQPAIAAQTVDQQYVAPADSIYTLPFGFEGDVGSVHRVQTATVGMAGTLSQVDIQYQPALGDPVFTGFNVYATAAGGLPTHTLLGMGSLVREEGGWASFTTSVRVALGDIIAFEPTYVFSVAKPFGTSGWLYEHGVYNPYPGGASYDASNDGAYFISGIDLGFRTYVTADAVPGSPVPEPAGWALFIGGFGVVGSTMRRRKSNADLVTIDQARARPI